MRKKLFLANFIRYAWITATSLCAVTMFIGIIGFMKLGKELILCVVPILGAFGFFSMLLMIIYINKYDAPIHMKPDQYIINKSLKSKNKTKI